MTAKNSSLAGLLLLVAVPLIVEARSTSFPGTKNETSPDGKWELYSEPPVSDEGHKLRLKDRADGSTKTLLVFPRHLDALWAPNSERIAVTDYVGSDSSDCKIVEVRNAATSSVADALKATTLASALEGNHHSYVKCVRWRSPELIEVELDAYGDANPKGIASRALFDVRSGLATPVH